MSKNNKINQHKSAHSVLSPCANTPHLVLLGAGHAHLFVLQALIERLTNTQYTCRVTLISPDRWQYYSGMVPGWIEGTYSLDQCRIDIRALLESTAIDFIEQAAVDLDADTQTISLHNGERISYDLLSIDIGSEIRPLLSKSGGPSLTDTHHQLSIKPLTSFSDGWLSLIKHLRTTTESSFSLAVIGGGAAGVELAFAANAALKKNNPDHRVLLISGQKSVLSNFSVRTQRKVKQALARQHISVVSGHASSFDTNLHLDNGDMIEVSAVLTATGAKPAAWLTKTGIALDSHGYISVNAYHRSLSHPSIFAAGDTCSRTDAPLKRSGVHAVRAGPVLASNLLAILDLETSQRGLASHTEIATLKTFMPRRYSLFLLASGQRSAIGSWGPFTFSGRWVWRWKDHIDRGFIARFTKNKP